MNSASTRYVDEERAAALLGLSPGELLRLSKEAGLGHADPVGGSGHRMFTYQELYQLCRSTRHDS